ncbi:MAG: hypothetical protein WC841_01235 [Candidatus Shapirobacteria bacterium]|jgi:hypothetical protein
MEHRVSRRDLLRSGAAALAGLAAKGCMPESAPSQTAQPPANSNEAPQPYVEQPAQQPTVAVVEERPSTDKSLNELYDIYQNGDLSKIAPERNLDELDPRIQMIRQYANNIQNGNAKQIVLSDLDRFTELTSNNPETIKLYYAEDGREYLRVALVQAHIDDSKQTVRFEFLLAPDRKSLTASNLGDFVHELHHTIAQYDYYAQHHTLQRDSQIEEAEEVTCSHLGNLIQGLALKDYPTTEDSSELLKSDIGIDAPQAAALLDNSYSSEPGNPTWKVIQDLSLRFVLNRGIDKFKNKYGDKKTIFRILQIIKNGKIKEALMSKQFEAGRDKIDTYYSQNPISEDIQQQIETLRQGGYLHNDFIPQSYLSH